MANDFVHSVPVPNCNAAKLILAQQDSTPLSVHAFKERFWKELQPTAQIAKEISADYKTLDDIFGDDPEGPQLYQSIDALKYIKVYDKDEQGKLSKERLVEATEANIKAVEEAVAAGTLGSNMDAMHAYDWYVDHMGAILAAGGQLHQKKFYDVCDTGPRLFYDFAHRVVHETGVDSSYKSLLLKDLKRAHVPDSRIEEVEALLENIEARLGQLQETAKPFLTLMQDEVDALFPQQSRGVGI